MPPVVADSSPLHYLVLIGEAAVLPEVVGDVLIPPAVRGELDRPRTPEPVRAWVAAPPPWLRVGPAPTAVADPLLAALDAGEQAAIALALEVGAGTVLMDDRAGVAAALAKGLAVVGTIGLLDRAARRDLLDLAAAFGRLRATNFRYPPVLLDRLLAEDRARRGGT